MNSFMSDCEHILRMMLTTVRNQDGEPLGFLEKLWICTQILLGMIVVEHDESKD